MTAKAFQFYKNALILASFLTAVQGQQIGTYQSETHPPMTWQTCSAGGSCTTNQGSVVLDANWRWVHEVGSTTNCYTGNTWDSSVCSDDTSCAQNCAVDGADYQATYGITTSGNEVKIGFVTNNSNGKNVGSRLYMMADNTHYQMYKLLGQEFTFDVDVSTLACGLNGALYLVSMYADGGVSEYSNNKAGAQYGVGYCDSQCPSDLKFIGGQANIDGWQPSSNNQNTGTGGHGSCCPEMDIWESNMYAQAVTAHSCDSTTPVICSGNNCGGTYSNDRYAGPCDPDGCDFNPYRMGNHDFYGPGKTIDTTKKFTVVTQFITEDGTANSNLAQIKRYYVQNGNVYAQPDSTISGVSGNSINSDYCSAELSTFQEQGSFQTHGGLNSMSQALSNGMVLVMSLWDDYYADMLWLDSTYPTNATGTPGALRGPCATSSGNPTDVESSAASAYVAYSNIRVGPINSTFTGGSNPGGGGTTTTTTTTTTTSGGGPTGGGGGTAPHWGQCGGQGWTGPTQCAAPYTCQYSNPWYSQCL